jgi:GNAT superfamily N-acetyltransferase
MLHVKTMTAQDIPFAVKLTSEMNWQLAKEDFEFMMELEPEGCFTLFDDEERIGLATNVSYGKIAWFGNLIVDEKHRGRGAGSMLVEHSIKHLKRRKVRTIGLYAYPERIPFYTRLGFKYDSDFVVLAGKGFSSPPKASLRPAKEPDMMNIIHQDHACFGASRAKMLEPIIRDPDNLCYMHTENSGISGYAVAKVYRGMAELGPLACQKSRSDVAIDLVKATLNRLKGAEVSMFVPKKEQAILSMLTANGFGERFRVARMFHGPPAVSDCIYMAESLERG